MNLSRKQSDAWHCLEDNVTNELLYGGAAGGGKSFLGCLWHIYRRTTYPGSRGLIGRSKIARLEESTLVTLFEVAGLMGYRRGIDYKYNEQKHRISWSNGSETLLKDLFLYPSDPEFTSLGSTEFTDAFIDEATEISRKAKQIVGSRLRWKIKEFGLTPKLLMTCNPSPGWVKEDFIMDDNMNPVVLKPNQRFIQSTLDDNPDKHFRELYGKQLESLSEYDRQRLRFGDWNVKPEILNPFAYNFDYNKHVGKTRLLDKPLYLSIDFNLNPFCVIAFHMWRDNDGEHLHVVDEISIQHGSVNKMIDEIKLRYGKYLPNIKITGDYNGTIRQLSQQDNASNYLLLQRGLRIRQGQIITPPNPTHDNSRTDCNYFLYAFPDFKIGEHCRGLIFDLQNVECDAFGSIMKKNRLDLAQQSDRLDCFVGETLIETSAGRKEIKDIELGDMVLTRNGYESVIDKWDSLAEVWEYTFSDGSNVQCTKDHKFYTSSGWVEIFRIFEGNLNTWKLKQIQKDECISTTMAEDISSTKNKNISTLETNMVSIPDVCTETYGSTIMVKYQKVIRFIIKMRTHLTTILKTSNWFYKKNTCNIIQEKGLPKTQSTLKSSNAGELRLHLNGMRQKKVTNGTNKTQSIVGLATKSMVLENATNVAQNMRQGIRDKDSAQLIVNQDGEGQINQTLLKETVKNAKRNLPPINTNKEGSVKDHAARHQTQTVVKAEYIGIKKVYDITVEGDHEFYANGFLVHNCFRYAINTFVVDWISRDQKRTNWIKK